MANTLGWAAAGLAGGIAGATAMNLFARAVKAARDGREADGAAPGNDREGRGMQPPQAQTTAGKDAAVRLGSEVYEAVTGRDPEPALEHRLGVAAHYGFAASAGAVYGLLAAHSSAIRRWHGCLYGALVWAAADEGVVPALGLSRGPRELSWDVHLYSLAGHCVYGMTLESVVRSAVPHLVGRERAASLTARTI